MKLAKILLVSLALSLTACQCADAAAALQSPSQIVTMMDNGNLPGAEAAVKEVLAVKDTAKVHYILAQVYLKQGKRPDAQAELARANMMDPEHSYTDNAHYRPVADAIAGRVMPTAAPVAPVIVQAAPAQPAAPPDYTPLWVLLGLLGLGGVGFFGYVWYTDLQKKRKIIKDLEASIAALRIKTAALVQLAADAILKEKTSALPSDAKLRDLQLTNIKALNLYDRAKNTVLKTEHEVDLLMNEHRSLQSAITAIEYRDYTPPAPKVDKVDIEYEAPPKVKRVIQRTASAPATSHSHSTETVVVNSGSNPIADVLMVDMMLNESRRREADDADRRRREQQQRDDDDRRERAREEERRAEREREEERQSSWSSSSSSSDSGSSDSWSSSSSSSDSGSSDSW